MRRSERLCRTSAFLTVLALFFAATPIIAIILIALSSAAMVASSAVARKENSVRN